MYCPTCFHNTLKLSARGVVKLTFNGKSKDTSLFLYNLGKDTPEEMRQNLKDKVDEFFKWYSTFKSPDPIKEIEAYSNDYTCTNNCKIPLTTKITVIGLLFTQKEVDSVVKEVAEKYKVALQPKK